MATRFYFPQSLSPPVPLLTPSPNVGWDFNVGFFANNARRRTKTSKIVDAVLNTFTFSSGVFTNKNVSVRQYISDPIAAVSIINPTIKWQILVQELDAGAVLFTALHIRIVDRWGADKGIILPVTRDDVEMSSVALTNRQFIANPTVTINAQN